MARKPKPQGTPDIYPSDDYPAESATDPSGDNGAVNMVATMGPALMQAIEEALRLTAYDPLEASTWTPRQWRHFRATCGPLLMESEVTFD